MGLLTGSYKHRKGQLRVNFGKWIRLCHLKSAKWCDRLWVSGGTRRHAVSGLPTRIQFHDTFHRRGAPGGSRLGPIIVRVAPSTRAALDSGMFSPTRLTERLDYSLFSAFRPLSVELFSNRHARAGQRSVIWFDTLSGNQRLQISETAEGLAVPIGIDCRSGHQMQVNS